MKAQKTLDNFVVSANTPPHPVAARRGARAEASVRCAVSGPRC